MDEVAVNSEPSLQTAPCCSGIAQAPTPELPLDALTRILAFCSCLDSARAACVCTAWRAAVSTCQHLWRGHLQQEFGLTLVPDGTTAHHFFQLCVRSAITPALSDIQRFQHLVHAIDQHGGWSLQLTLPSGHTQMVTPTKVNTHVQSVWIEFDIPVPTEPQNTSEGVQPGGQRGSPCGYAVRLVATAPGAAAPAARASGTDSLQLATAPAGESRHLSTLNVITHPRVSFDGDETYTLLLSHTDGLYAWTEPDAGPRLVAYVHMEHLLPLALGVLHMPQALHGRWGALPYLFGDDHLTPAKLPAPLAAAATPATQKATAATEATSQPALQSPAVQRTPPTPPTLPLLANDSRDAEQAQHQALHTQPRPSTGQPTSQRLLRRACQTCAIPFHDPSYPQHAQHGRSAETHHAQDAQHANAAEYLGALLHVDLSQLSASSSEDNTTQSFVLRVSASVAGRDSGQVWQFGSSAGAGQWVGVERGGVGTGADARLAACVAALRSDPPIHDPLVDLLQATSKPPSPHTQPTQQALARHAVDTRQQGPASQHTVAAAGSKGGTGVGAALPVATRLHAVLERTGMADFALYHLHWPWQHGQRGETQQRLGPQHGERDQIRQRLGPQHSGRGETRQDAAASGAVGSEGRNREGGLSAMWADQFPEAVGRLLIGRCGLEVWKKERVPDDISVRQEWRTLLAQGSVNVHEQDNAETDVLDLCTLHFMVDGVCQKLWDNSLDFWFAPTHNPHTDTHWQETGTGSHTDHFGVLRLNMTDKSAAKLWGFRE